MAILLILSYNINTYFNENGVFIQNIDIFRQIVLAKLLKFKNSIKAIEAWNLSLLRIVLISIHKTIFEIL